MNSQWFVSTDCARTTSRWWLLLPVLIILGSGWCGLLLVHYGPVGMDTWLLLWFRNGQDSAHIAGPQWVTEFWLAWTWLGGAPRRMVMAGMVIIGLWFRGRWRSALFTTGILSSGLALSTMLKLWVARPRPQLVAHLVSAGSASFPSGHALNSTLFYMVVALLLAPLLRGAGRRRALYALGASLSLATGLSRIALGVHWPSDVIGGWIIGAAWLWLWLALAGRYWPQVLPRTISNE